MDKILSFETQLACVEDGVLKIKASLVDLKTSQWKDLEDHDELNGLREEVAELKEESAAQGKLLESIQEILKGLKTNGGSLDKAVLKIETSTRNNAFNVSDTRHIIAEKNTQQYPFCRLVPVKPSFGSWVLRTRNRSKMLCLLVTTIIIL